MQAKIASGELAPVGAEQQVVAVGAPVRPATVRTDAELGADPGSGLTYTKEGRNSALVFLLGVVVIVILGLFPDLRPSFAVEGEAAGAHRHDDARSSWSCSSSASLILFVGRPDVKTVPDQSVFKAGMISAIALFGIAWLTATFIAAHEDYIVEHHRRLGHRAGSSSSRWPSSSSPR